MSLFSCVFYRQKDEFLPFIPRIFTFSLRLFNFWSHFVATTFQDTGQFSQEYARKTAPIILRFTEL